MFKLAALIEQHKETLATIETWDNGLCMLIVRALITGETHAMQESHTK